LLGAVLPEQVFEQLDRAAIDGICSRLALAGWTRATLLAALDQRRAALGKARGPGLAMSVLRDLEHSTPPRPDVCPNGCVDGWLNADGDRPTPCPTCKPATARRIAEQHAQPWTLGPRPTGRTA